MDEVTQEINCDDCEECPQHYPDESVQVVLPHLLPLKIKGRNVVAILSFFVL